MCIVASATRMASKCQLFHHVRDDAVMRWLQPRDDGVVIRKRLDRKDRREGGGAGARVARRDRAGVA